MTRAKIYTGVFLLIAWVGGGVAGEALPVVSISPAIPDFMTSIQHPVDVFAVEIVDPGESGTNANPPSPTIRVKEILRSNPDTPRSSDWARTGHDVRILWAADLPCPHRARRPGDKFPDSLYSKDAGNCDESWKRLSMMAPPARTKLIVTASMIPNEFIEASDRNTVQDRQSINWNGIVADTPENRRQIRLADSGGFLDPVNSTSSEFAQKRSFIAIAVVFLWLFCVGPLSVRFKASPNRLTRNLYWLLPLFPLAAAMILFDVISIGPHPSASRTADPLLVVLFFGCGFYVLQLLVWAYTFRCGTCGYIQTSMYRSWWWSRGAYWCPRCNQFYAWGRLVKPKPGVPQTSPEKPRTS